ncbi:flippase [uncultured Draconibacterium sp.]|uniref:flippase n=1 Tax=uncultured Draconibacterium sp. TaxID=1573823 RepID=UPI0029C90338|nr:flippase [uncultured Draconibacterium sp.]
MLDKIKQVTSNHKVLIQNFSYLSALQVFNMLVPLITYPYLIRVLGKETYGLVVYAQAIVGYLVILIDFGFNISATKEISIHRNNKEKLEEVVSSVFIIKGALFFISVIILISLTFIIPQAKEYKTLFLLTLWMCLYNVIFPIWYFQGIEQMKYITYITLVSRLSFLGLIFIFIKSQNDYLFIPILNGVGALIAGIAALYIIFIKHYINFRIPKKAVLNKYFKDSLIIFTSRISSLKDNTPTFLIGTFLGNSEVAYYDLVYKVIRVLISVFDNITNVFFPRVAKSKDHNLNRRIVKFELVFIVIAYTLLCIFAKQIVLIIGGEQMLPSIPIFYILGLLLLRPLSSFIGATVLVTNNLTKEFSKNLIYATIVYFLITLLLFPLKIVSVYTFAMTIVLALFFEIGHRLYIIRKNQLKHWIL